jgi:O-antigen/teichoic acid export membrane protein
MIPSLGLQTTLAQEGAAVITDEDRARYTGTVRGVLLWTFILWFCMAVLIGIFQNHFLSTLTITNPTALWLVVIIGLGLLWQPIIQGVLQGKQNFLWLGWVLIANGVGRLIAVAIIIILFNGKATGAIAGALIVLALL